MEPFTINNFDEKNSITTHMVRHWCKTCRHDEFMQWLNYPIEPMELRCNECMSVITEGE